MNTWYNTKQLRSSAEDVGTQEKIFTVVLSTVFHHKPEVQYDVPSEIPSTKDN